jgi:hypothetical protein
MHLAKLTKRIDPSYAFPSRERESAREGEGISKKVDLLGQGHL